YTDEEIRYTEPTIEVHCDKGYQQVDIEDDGDFFYEKVKKKRIKNLAYNESVSIYTYSSLKKIADYLKQFNKIITDEVLRSIKYEPFYNDLLKLVEGHFW
ncbi:hypothetical protein ACFL56_00910, partial [Candidatus Margulisiibacteriota bacterium]